MDRTFCASPGCEGKCGREWTRELYDRAREWWGDDDPLIAFGLFCGDGGLTLTEAVRLKHKKVVEDEK